MLAATLLPSDVESTDENVLAAMKKLSYPVLASLKLDGVRALRLNGTLLSRTLKPIPNISIRARSVIFPGGFDMELFNPEMDYNEIQSIVMSQHHKDEGKIQFHILDWYQEDNRPYEARLQRILSWFGELDYTGSVRFNHPHTVRDAEHLLWHEKIYIESHGEGICFRTPMGPYKFGRSTLKEQYLVKHCRRVRDEAVVIGFTEAVDGEGNPKGYLGALLVRNKIGQEFPVGTGFNAMDRHRMWNYKGVFDGETIVYDCKAHGQKVMPRQPSFKGFRNQIDII